MPASPARNTFRRYDLDGAALWFHPATGTHVRVDAPATRHLRRTAPRVVMFGITNACNLTCSYCSRDAGRPSTWTVDGAAALLEDLAAAGALEVAFGGGEPFAFRGFAELLERLHATTVLALNVTTNGTLLTPSLLERVGPLLGQVRLSLHDSADWRAAAHRLAASPARWGANVLIDDAAVAGLPDLLEELHALGASDASLLGYVGPDPARHPSAASLARCAEIVRDSPLPCRASVCFGQRLGVDRLLADLDATGDCGAGADFVTITPDRRLQACSFQDDGLPIADAADLLRRWRQQRSLLDAPSPRRGCARREWHERGAAAPCAPALRVWQAFSGNNSSECHLVARFRDVADAERLLARLTGLPRSEGSWHDPDTAPWYELFTQEGIAGPDMKVDRDREGYGFEPPEELGVVGRTLVAHHGETLGHFKELTALAWREGAECRTEVGDLAFAIRAGDAAAAAELAARPLPASEALPWPGHVATHGEFVVGTLRPDFERLAEIRALLERHAGGLPVGFEPLSGRPDAAALQNALMRLGVDVPLRPRLHLAFGWPNGPDAAARFAATIDDHAAVSVGRHVLVDDAGRKRRIALRAHAAGGEASSLEAERLEIESWWSLPRAFVGRRSGAVSHALAMARPNGWVGLDVDKAVATIEARLRPRLRAELQQEFEFAVEWNEPMASLRSRVGTALPMVAWPIVGAVAAELELDAWHRLVEPDQLVLAIWRMLAELRSRRA